MPPAREEDRFDVFISYRRGAADELALLLQRELERHNLSAFLDRDLRRGTFDDKLLGHIADAPTFLIILTPNALDRCSDEDDWLRKEIVHAIGSRRNIVPLKIDPFGYTPELIRGLDPAVRELSRYQAVEYSRAYFENTIERIVHIVDEGKAERSLPVMPAAGTVQTDPKDGQNYAWIPPGTFQMGCLPGDSECQENEKPVHTVKITKGFWMGQTPVTQAAYQQVMGANPSDFQGEQLPVENITWEQANAYCEKVGMRLPTEAEWEYAARAGRTGPRYGELNAIAWYDGNSGGRIHEVAQKQANAWNLYDMLGNVWEWVGDWYAPNYYQQSPSEDASGPSSGEYRVVRGGSWSVGSRYLRAANRYWYDPGLRDVDIGFRCVREVPL